jgi:hypothetical protein
LEEGWNRKEGINGAEEEAVERRAGEKRVEGEDQDLGGWREVRAGCGCSYIWCFDEVFGGNEGIDLLKAGWDSYTGEEYGEGIAALTLI